LGTNPEFLRIIEAARKEIRAGKMISFEELEKTLEMSANKKKSKPKPRSRHRSKLS
jgi:hypothetical protein